MAAWLPCVQHYLSVVACFVSFCKIPWEILRENCRGKSLNPRRQALSESIQGSIYTIKLLNYLTAKLLLQAHNSIPKSSFFWTFPKSRLFQNARRENTKSTSLLNIAITWIQLKMETPKNIKTLLIYVFLKCHREKRLGHTGKLKQRFSKRQVCSFTNWIIMFFFFKIAIQNSNLK